MQVLARGIPVHFIEAGAGRPILVLHGLGADHRFGLVRYEPILAGRRGWRRIYPDLPGMGQTPGSAWITGPDEVLDVLLGFIDAVMPGERFSLVGISWGAYMARGIVEHMADRIDGLMLTVPVIHGAGADRDLPPRVVLRRDEGIEELLLPGETPWTQLAVIQTPPMLEAFRAAVKPGLQLADWEFLRGLAPRFGPGITEGRLSRPLDAPALILTGRHDVAVGYRDAWPLMADLPRGTFVALDGAGHGVEEEQGTLFAALVGEWLDRVEAWTPPG